MLAAVALFFELSSELRHRDVAITSEQALRCLLKARVFLGHSRLVELRGFLPAFAARTPRLFCERRPNDSFEYSLAMHLDQLPALLEARKVDDRHCAFFLRCA